MSVSIRSGEGKPTLGNGEVVHSHLANLTGATTAIMIPGGDYTTWVESYVLRISTAAAGHTVSLVSALGSTVETTIWSFSTTLARGVVHNYNHGWPVPPGRDVSLVISGGSPVVNVSVEAIRKLSNQSPTT